MKVKVMTLRQANAILVDTRAIDRLPWWERAVVRLFRRTINKICNTILSHGYERGLINSPQLHQLLEIKVRILHPDRFKALCGQALEIKRSENEGGAK